MKAFHPGENKNEGERAKTHTVPRIVILCVHPLRVVDVKQKLFCRLREGSQANDDDIDLGGESADDSDMNLESTSDNLTSTMYCTPSTEVASSEDVARFMSLSSAGSPSRSMSSAVARELCRRRKNSLLTSTASTGCTHKTT